MRRCLGGFEATALVDGNINENRARLHAADQLARHQFRCRRTGNQHRTDDHVGFQHMFLQGSLGRIDGFQCRTERL